MLGLLMVALVTLTACGGDEAGDRTPKVIRRSTTSAPEEQVLLSSDAALERATSWLSANLETVDNTPSLMFVEYVGRNWTIPELSPSAHDLAKTREPWGQSLLLWRLIDPEFPPPDQQIVAPFDTQELLSSALFCDERPLQEDFSQAIDEFINQGGYLASHAGIALQWVREHGCELPEVSARVELLVSVLVGELEQATVADDLGLEQGAVLAYVGAADRIPEQFVELAVRHQHPDGGWGINSPDDPSNWHPTLFGLWMLCALHGDGNGASMMEIATGAVG